MEAELSEQQAKWLIRGMWFLSGGLVFNSTNFLGAEYLWQPMNVAGAILSLVAGVIFTGLSIRWDNQLIKYLKEEN